MFNPVKQTSPGFHNPLTVQTGVDQRAAPMCAVQRRHCSAPRCSQLYYFVSHPRKALECICSDLYRMRTTTTPPVAPSTLVPNLIMTKHLSRQIEFATTNFISGQKPCCWKRRSDANAHCSSIDHGPLCGPFSYLAFAPSALSNTAHGRVHAASSAAGRSS